MKKIIFIGAILFLMPFYTFAAANIDIKTDKTTLTMDDVVHVSVSVNGSVDNGQIGIKGLENFSIIGKQASQSVQTINGQTSTVQTQELTLQPKVVGTTTIVAMAKENGKNISSKSINIVVEKSQEEKVKDNLLGKTNSVSNGTGDTQLQNKSNSQKDKITNNQESQNKIDLLKPQNEQSQQSGQENQTQDLKLKELQNFPQVKHISAFNAFFWIEFLGVLLLVLLIIFSIILFVKKIRNKPNFN